MKGPDPVTEKRPILLLEDLGYALKQLSSIIKDDDYEGLGNHATGPWGRLAYLVWHRYAHPSLFFFPVPSYCCLVLTFVFDSCWG